MKHLAIPAMSVRLRDTPYTTPGLGDRVHSCLLGYNYALAQDCEVTLHLTIDKVTGGKPGGVSKEQSWLDILDLFPGRRVHIQSHPVAWITNEEWLAYLRRHGIAAECYHYGDTYGMYACEEWFPLDIAPYLKASPQIPPSDCSKGLGLPSVPYVTQQWDTGGDRRDVRRIPEDRIERIRDAYRDEGYELVTVGGEAKDNLLRTSLRHVGYVMANAEAHVGVDSGPMHVASLYLPYERLHVYAGKSQHHHVRRWVANGAKLNRHGGQP